MLDFKIANLNYFKFVLDFLCVACYHIKKNAKKSETYPVGYTLIRFILNI